MKTAEKGSALVTVMIISVLILMVIIAVSSISNTIYKTQLESVADTRDTYLARSLTDALAGIICEVDAAGVKGNDAKRLLDQLRGVGGADSLTRWLHYGDPNFSTIFDAKVSFDYAFTNLDIPEEEWPDYVIYSQYDSETGTIQLTLKDETPDLNDGPKNLLQLDIGETLNLSDDGWFKDLLDNNVPAYGVNETVVTSLQTRLTDYGANAGVPGDAIRTQYVDETFTPTGSSPCIIYVEAGKEATIQPHDVAVSLSSADNGNDVPYRCFFVGAGGKLIFDETQMAGENFLFQDTGSVYFMLGEGASVEYHSDGLPHEISFSLATIAQWWAEANIFSGTPDIDYPSLKAMAEYQCAIAPDDTLFEQYYDLVMADKSDMGYFLSQVESMVSDNLGTLDVDGTLVGGTGLIKFYDEIAIEIKNRLTNLYIETIGADVCSKDVQLAFSWYDLADGVNWRDIITDEEYRQVSLGTDVYCTPYFVKEADPDSPAPVSVTCVEVESGSRLILKKTLVNPVGHALTVNLNEPLFIFLNAGATFESEYNNVDISNSNNNIFVVDFGSNEVGYLGNDGIVHYDMPFYDGDLYDHLHNVIDDGAKLDKLENMMHYEKAGYVSPPPEENDNNGEVY